MTFSHIPGQKTSISSQVFELFETLNASACHCINTSSIDFEKAKNWGDMFSGGNVNLNGQMLKNGKNKNLTFWNSQKARK